MAQGTLDFFLLKPLCITCKRIDFRRLCRQGSLKQYRPSLGTVQDVLARFESRQCFLCTLIARAIMRRCGGRDLQGLQCYIGPDCYAQLPGHLGEIINFNKLSVRVVNQSTYFPKTVLVLQPCSDPVPHVSNTRDFAPEPRYSMQPSGRLIAPYYQPHLLRQWMSCCHERHGNACHMPAWRSTDDDTFPQLRFVDTEQFCIVDSPEDCQYAALSYVWGSAAHNRLTNTQRTARWLRDPGCLLLNDVVPKTIFDAIQVARSIGFKYLWIDSLCIIQDDDDDKRRQLSYMDCVYANAYCTIAAVNALHVDMGITGVRDSLMRHPQQAMVPVSSSLHLIRTTHLYTGTAYEKSSWKRRAWTMKESLLSRRLIMFTDDEVFWRCQRATWCESLALEVCSMQQMEPRITSYQSFGCYDLMEIGPSQAFRPEYAYRVISQYAKRSITNQSDSLKAIQGYLHRLYMKHTLAQSNWGHLLFLRFDESLAWIGGDCARRVAEECVYNRDGSSHRVRFPSWSWLGWDFEHAGLGKLFNLPIATAMVMPELEFYKLDIHGRFRAQMPRHLFAPYVKPLDLSALDEELARGWKHSTSINEDDFSCVGFHDSGRLLFWTSATTLQLNKVSQEGDLGYEWEMTDQHGRKVGGMPEHALPSSTNEGNHCLIVVSRVHDEMLVEKVLPKLHVLVIEWDDLEQRVAHRIGAGSVDEAAWVRAKPEWIKVTLA
ncbi:HET domain-containing protein [Fusarium sp. LHS14.1]|nr:HET domain-containing protein [Fusarium sp. LHS14.1]